MATIRAVGIGDIKDVGLIYGGNLLGYSTELGLKFLDTMRPEGWMGQPLSFWGDLLGAAGGVLGALYLDAPYSLLSALIGGYLATDMVEHIVRIAAPLAGVAIPPQFTRPPIIVTPPVTVPPSVVAQGRYAVVV